MKKIEILETTLRDGSYAVNFSFTSTDTFLLCKSLEDAGFKYIEIGHGVGLNAGKKGYGVACQTDEEYMIAAKNAITNSKYGMFCIPKIARLEDIDLAAKHDMGFIRIGSNVTEVENSKEYIQKAKDYGLLVSSNFMKSYALPPEKFAEKVKKIEKYGVDLIYLVDSAGGMFLDDIQKYYKEIRKFSDIQLGFHGHDNLGLAVSNSIGCADMGFSFIDSSLQGLGRSSGNAATEIMIAALLKKGYHIDIDLLKTMEIGQKFIQPLLSVKGKMPLDIISGYAEFHSSYMHHIQKYSAKYSVNPALLILEIARIDKVDIDEKILEKIAKRLKKETDVYSGKFDFSRYFGHEQDNL